MIINTTREKLVKAISLWNQQQLENPADFESDVTKYDPEVQADYLIELINQVE